MSEIVGGLGLSDKERVGRALDVTASALQPYVHERMAQAVPGRDWVELYRASESTRLQRQVQVDPSDVKELLSILRHTRGVFDAVARPQRAWLDELLHTRNQWAHSPSLPAATADRALDTMALLLDALDLPWAAAEIRALADEGSPVTDTVVDEDVALAVDRALLRLPEPEFPSTMTEAGQGLRLLRLVAGPLEVGVYYREALNYALVANAVSPVVQVKVVNHGATDLADSHLTISLAGLPGDYSAAPLSVRTGPIEADDSVILPIHLLAWHLSPTVFAALTEACAVEIVATVQVESSLHDVTATGAGGVRLLAVDEWTGASIPEVLAAFVRPNDRILRPLLEAASDLLQERTGTPSLQGYQAGPDRVSQIAEAVYDAMRDLQIRYSNPPASFERMGQKIRTHAEVLEERWGTCIDLACTYAAALEAAGLNPFLVLTKAHAFAGYLLEEMELPTVAISDPAVLTTLADSSTFDSVELTALTVREVAVPFDSARGDTRKWWSSQLDEVLFALDIKAAHRLIKPLPAMAMDGGTRVIEVAAPEMPAPLRRRGRHGEAAPAPQDDTPARIQNWRRSLLDLTLRNPLLNLKLDRSRVTVHVPADALGPLEDLLAAEQVLTLQPHDQLSEMHRAQGARTAQDVDATTLRKLLEGERRLYVALPGADYAKRLQNLTRKARTLLEETGANNLFLTIGALHWIERGRPAAAPLFLMPVRLTGGKGMPFRLQADETGSVQPNYCLIEKLRATRNLVIPALTDPGQDDSGADIEGALQEIRTGILSAGLEGFRVEETATLGILQFTTLELWRDLSDNWRDFMARAVVRHLVETPGEVYGEDADEPVDSASEAELYLPIPADGSQMEAIRWAQAKRTFILQGPPGTGKSQTITNLIANCLANGQRVLFVAEKQAALQVVKTRLEAVGLGPFSLDLHGRTQTVAAVREQLSAALEISTSTSATWQSLRDSYRTLVRTLSSYPDRLHQEGPAGLSAWDARQVILGVENHLGPAAELAEGIAVPLSVVSGDVDLRAVYEAAAQLSYALQDLGGSPGRSPWRLGGPVPPEALDLAAAARAVETLLAADRAVSPGLRAMMELVDGLEQFEPIERWLGTLASGTAVSTAHARSVVSPHWRSQIGEALKALEWHRNTYSPQLGPFSPAILDRDLDLLLTQAGAADESFLHKKARRRALLAELAAVTRPGVEIDAATLTGLIRQVISVRAANLQLLGYLAQVPGLAIPYGWNPFTETGDNPVGVRIQALEAAAALSTAFGDSPRIDAASEGRLAGHADPADDLPAVGGLDRAWRQILTLLGSRQGDLDAWREGRELSAALARDSADWQADSHNGGFIRLQRWQRMRSILGWFDDLGITDLGDRIRDGAVTGESVESVVRLAVTRAVLDERLDTTTLRSFEEKGWGRQIDRFVATGEDIRGQLATELPARIVAARTFEPRQRAGQNADFMQQLGRRRGGLAIRELFRRYGSIISQITPCLLTSPNSVARFLAPGSVDFDVVVFDEASQIRVSEAIGAMGRATAVVIVGDSKQMPPTAMFSAGGDDTDEESVDPDTLPVPADLESILSEGAESRLPTLALSWHYRSQDESLIAFSNHHYYEGRLASFPTPPRGDSEHGVKLRRVEGVWEGGRGGARVNRAEADAVVQEIRDRLDADPGASLGVVTFNSQQRDLILDQLESCDDENVAAGMTRPEEAIFVKNLENVQGDERDVILFTLAFARDEATGRVPLNWGPLTRSGGERRLNVAITRAKREVLIFSSFEPQELDLTKSTSLGLAHLRDYLLLARNGAERAGLSTVRVQDLHLDDVAAALVAAGLEVKKRIGLSDFTVDLAVRASRAHAWIAVLLDGPDWARRGTVGDREGLPSSVLVASMGWSRVERIWLPSWLRDRPTVIEEIVVAARSAVGVHSSVG